MNILRSWSLKVLLDEGGASLDGELNVSYKINGNTRQVTDPGNSSTLRSQNREARVSKEFSPIKKLSI